VLAVKLWNIFSILVSIHSYSFVLYVKVNDVKVDLSQIGFDIEAIQQMVAGLEGKIELLENKQASECADCEGKASMVSVRRKDTGYN